MKLILTAAMPLLILTGCASPSLVQRMDAHGVTHLNTGKIVLHGSEADVGAGVKLDVVEHFLIQRIWDAVYQSRPEITWYASGYRRADFYVDTNLDTPACTLWINASDACHLDGEGDRFRCPQLDGFVTDLLRKARQTSESLCPGDGS